MDPQRFDITTSHVVVPLFFFNQVMEFYYRYKDQVDRSMEKSEVEVEGPGIERILPREEDLERLKSVYLMDGVYKPRGAASPPVEEVGEKAE